MLKFGNKEFRNLQEQVLENMRNIQNITEGTAVLSEFGIKVVGEVASLQNLPTVAEYKTAHPDWEYGDAFAIGTEAPYTLVILTRANDEITADHWFDIGDFPAPGPQGAQGPQGEQGPQGQTGPAGDDGLDAGFGSVLATAQTLAAGSSATVSVTASGPNTAKEFSFVFGIPRGRDGEGAEAAWGSITGTLSDQTDLQTALDGKQASLVSGTNIKTINNTSILGSGNIDIQSAVWGNITGTLSNQTDLNTALSGKQDTISDLSTIRSGAALGATAVQPAAISDMATETWVGQQGYLTSVSWSDVSGKPTFATVATSGDYADLTNKPSIPSKTSDLTNDSGFIDKNVNDLTYYTLTSALATVATSGSYNDLTDKPTIPVVDYPVTDVTVDGSSVVSNKVAAITLPSVTLTDTAYVSPDYILRGMSINGEEWSIPSVPANIVTDVTLGGSSVVSSGVAALPAYPTVPTNVSSFTNDAGYQTAANVATAIAGQTKETWTFTLADGTTTTKTIVLG